MIKFLEKIKRIVFKEKHPIDFDKLYRIVFRPDVDSSWVLIYLKDDNSFMDYDSGTSEIYSFSEGVKHFAIEQKIPCIFDTHYDYPEIQRCLYKI